ncbi:MAG: CgeB family protein [Cellulosilyticaceae bacterium]
MRVLLFGKDQIFLQDLIWGFENEGHQVRGIMPESIADYQKEISQQEVDLVMTFGSPSCYNRKEIIAFMGTRGVDASYKYIHWDTDGITWARDYEMPFVLMGKPDLVLTICPDFFLFLKSQNIPCEMLAYGFNPTTHYMMNKEEEKQGVVFVGNSYGNIIKNQPNHYRTLSVKTLIGAFAETNIPLEIWGDSNHLNVIRNIMGYPIPEQYYKGKCPYELTRQVYEQAFVNLVPQNHPGHLTKRTYEILASGGVMITYDTPEVRRAFRVGEELLVAKTTQEVLTCYNTLKNDEAYYNEIRQKGYQAVQRHSYASRVKEIMGFLGEMSM